MSSPEFPRAGTGKEEGDLSVLDQPMNLIENGWDFLDFVYDEQSLVVLVSFPQKGWMRSILSEKVCFEEIQDDRPFFRQGMSDPVALAHLSRSPEEGGSPGRKVYLEESIYYFTHKRNYIRIFFPHQEKYLYLFSRLREFRHCERPTACLRRAWRGRQGAKQSRFSVERLLRSLTLPRNDAQNMVFGANGGLVAVSNR